RFAQPAYSATNAGRVTSQGDRAMRADIARATVGVTGAGVTVGVLSDSFNCRGGAATDVATGDLSPVTVLLEEPGCGSGTDEGRAMLQIVHDVAPSADLAFATAFAGVASFAANIRALATAGARLVLQWDSPFFSVGGTGTPNDVDVYILNTAATQILAAATTNNIGSGDPVELVGFANPGATAVDVNIMIVTRAGPNPGRIKYV